MIPVERSIHEGVLSTKSRAIAIQTDTFPSERASSMTLPTTGPLCATAAGNLSAAALLLHLSRGAAGGWHRATLLRASPSVTLIRTRRNGGGQDVRHTAGKPDGEILYLTA